MSEFPLSASSIPEKGKETRDQSTALFEDLRALTIEEAVAALRAHELNRAVT